MPFTFKRIAMSHLMRVTDRYPYYEYSTPFVTSTGEIHLTWIRAVELVGGPTISTRSAGTSKRKPAPHYREKDFGWLKK
jgi:hypothetical protein